MTDDEIDDRLSKRFKSDDSDATNDMKSQPDRNAGKSQNAQNTTNIKKEWNVRSFYPSDDLDDDVTTAFKRLDLDLDGTDADIDLKKTRHFDPLIIELGLERLESMEVTEHLEK